jgi:hypothetical protein
MMQPKNSQRRDAIGSKKYVEILTKTEATDFLTQQLQAILRAKTQTLSKSLIADAQGKLNKQSLALFL